MNAHISELEYVMKSQTTRPLCASMYSGRESLFFKSVRGLNAPCQYKYLAKSCKESVVDTFLIAFYIRDCRFGKGEREVGRRLLIWLFINQPLLFSKVIHYIPEYGRWDDILYFFPGVLDLSVREHVQDNYVSVISSNKHLNVLTIQKDMVRIYANQLIKDQKNMLEGKKCSFAAKWAPTEGDSLDRQYGIYLMLAREMKISARSLRKKYLTPLRSYLHVVERFMCDRNWSNIDYNKVPSCAMKRLKNSFENHDKDRYIKWGMTKVNVKQLKQPYELVREMRTKGYADKTCEAQWDIIEKKYGALNNDVVVVDTSYSMRVPNYVPFDVAVSMGLLCSKGKFNNIVFNTTPSCVIIQDNSLYQRWSQIANINWGGSTNIESAFELIIERGKKYSLSQDEMPKRLWIVSDMKTDDLINFEAIDKMYAKFNYKRPQIIFWNVNGSSSDFKVSIDDCGTAKISGYSPSIMNSILLSNGYFSANKIMMESIVNERYNLIRKALV
jgi:hypothetical protein